MEKAYRYRCYPTSEQETLLRQTLGCVRLVYNKALAKGCTPSTITIKLDPRGRWFVSLLVDDPTVKLLPQVEKAIGIDLGITSLIATSDGNKVANPKHFKRLRQKLKRAQKALSHKQKRSNNRKKTRLKVAKIHGKIADSRQDFLHKLTTELIRENQTIVVESLAIKNMVKNRKLAQAISDASWGELTRQLKYKSAWYGRTLVEIDRWFPSSKKCGNCGHIVEKMPLNIRDWECPSCGYRHDRDLNAAKNILAAGLAVTVCRANVRPDRDIPKRQLRNTPSGKKQKAK